MGAGLNGTERRNAERYRTPGKARVYWGQGSVECVSLSDMSGSGCQVVGNDLPCVGTRVFLSLELNGLPNVRLPATVMRRAESRDAMCCGLRFEVPSQRMAGVTRLLGALSGKRSSSALRVVAVDSDERSRERVLLSLRNLGADVYGVDNAIDALAAAKEHAVNLLLARADAEGLAALAAFAHGSPHTFRVVFGRGSALGTALNQGFAEATADDPCSAKSLGELMRRQQRFTHDD